MDKNSDKEVSNYVEKFEHDRYRVFRSELQYIRKKRNATKKIFSDKNNSNNDQLIPKLNADRPSTKHNLFG